MELRPAEIDALPDCRLGIRVWEMWLVLFAEKKGLAIDRIDTSFQLSAVATTLSVPIEGVGNAGLGKVLRAAASGDYSRAGKMYRELIGLEARSIRVRDEAKTGRLRQRANAQKSRGGSLQKLIEDIMRADPSISEQDLYAALKARDDDG